MDTGEAVEKIVDWLETKPDARVDRAALFQLEGGALEELPLVDPSKVLDYISALSSRAVEVDAPPQIREAFEEFDQLARTRVTALGDEGSFMRRTLVALRGVESLADARFVLRGAMAHAVDASDQVMLAQFNDGLGPTGMQSKIIGGGSWYWCGVGCFLCIEVGCLACCTIML